jgi:DNA-binding transcriptional regulator YhcF (GntR family)
MCYNNTVLKREYERTTKEGDKMADILRHKRKGGDKHMSHTEIQRLIKYLRSIGWTDEQILKLIDILTRR